MTTLKMHRRVNAILSAGYDKICFHYFSKQRLKTKCEYVRPYKALPFFYKVFITRILKNSDKG